MAAAVGGHASWWRQRANMAANSMAVFERTEKPADWKLTTIPVGKRPEGIDISADGKELWVAHSDTVSIIDIASKKVKETFSVQTKVSNKLTFTPDGKRVLISDNTGNELVVLDAATRKQIKRLKLGNKVTKFQVEPDGSRVYVANADDNIVVTIDLKTFQEIGRFSTGIDPDGMATHWSTYESHVRLPLRFDGSRFELTYRFSRVYGETAEVELRVNGGVAESPLFDEAMVAHQRGMTGDHGLCPAARYRLELR